MLIIFIVISSIFVFSSCAYTPVVESQNLNTVAELNYGTITNIKPIYIDDETDKRTQAFIGNQGAAIGAGAGIGALVGIIAGKNITSTLVGSGAGALAGAILSHNPANGQELYVRLDRGKTIVVDIKGKNFSIGDRCELVHNNNKLVRINKIQNSYRNNIQYIDTNIPAPGNY